NFNYNSANFNTLNVQGLDGNDIFNVYTAATNPPTNRKLQIDGGQPTGKKKQTDTLNVFYTPPRPSIIQSTATQNPTSGIVDLNYGTSRFVVQYDDIEQVPAPKALREAKESARTDAGANQSRFANAWRCAGSWSWTAHGSRIVGERARRAGAVGRTRTDLCSPRVDAKFRDCERSADRGAACTYHER